MPPMPSQHVERNPVRYRPYLSNDRNYCRGDPGRHILPLFFPLMLTSGSPDLDITLKIMLSIMPHAEGPGRLTVIRVGSRKDTLDMVDTSPFRYRSGRSLRPLLCFD